MSRLSPDLEQYVQQKVASGQFTSQEEFAQEAMRLYRDIEARHESLKDDVRAAIEQSEKGHRRFYYRGCRYGHGTDRETRYLLRPSLRQARAEDPCRSDIPARAGDKKGSLGPEHRRVLLRRARARRVGRSEDEGRRRSVCDKIFHQARQGREKDPERYQGEVPRRRNQVRYHTPLHPGDSQ